MNSMLAFPWLHNGYNFQVLFKALGTTPAAHVEEAIKKAAQEVLYPDGIILLSLYDEAEEVTKILKDYGVQTSLKRLEERTGFYSLSIKLNQKDARVKILKSKKLVDLIEKELHDSEIIEGLLNSGVQHIFSLNEVVIPAPPGYHFLKPSGASASHFIRAEEALYDSQFVDFLALYLLIKRGSCENIQTIYIDTMGISCVAYAVRELLIRQSQEHIPRIVSFHSHSGLDNIDAPMPETAYCIISASSSLSLEKKWIEKTRCKSHDVVTLLTFKDAVGYQNAIFAFDKPRNWIENEIATVRQTKLLRTLGERFQQEQLPLKKVTLSKDHHPLSNIKKLVTQFGSSNFLDIDVATPIGKRRAFYVSGDKLVNDSSFKSWLEKELRSRVPASIQGIIYQDDPHSLEMAMICRDYLRGLNITLEWGVFSSTEYEKQTVKLDNQRGLLIIAAIVGQGNLLLGISRDLRDHYGSKSYLIGLQVCSTRSESVFLRSNLCASKDQTNYFNVWNCIATGSAMQQSLKEADHLIKSYPSIRTVDIYIQRSRLGAGLGNAALLPIASGEFYLALRKDFLFWDDNYEPGDHNVALVLATIGAVLENARTDKNIEERYCLYSNGIQHVVLDPQNFNRFNDGIIQASILRLAYPFELDYSSTHEESAFMREFLLKIFSARFTTQGEAAMEFALALATHRLRINATDLNDVCVKTYKKLGRRQADKDIKLLLQIASKSSKVQPSEF